MYYILVIYKISFCLKNYSPDLKNICPCLLNSNYSFKLIGNKIFLFKDYPLDIKNIDPCLFNTNYSVNTERNVKDCVRKCEMKFLYKCDFCFFLCD